MPGYRLLRRSGEAAAAPGSLATTRRRRVVLKLRAAPTACLRASTRVAAARQPALRAGARPARDGDWPTRDGIRCRRHLRAPSAAPAAASARPAAAGGRALAQLHRRKLVHRDVKPANFLLRADGSLVLADFGLVTPRRAGSACARRAVRHAALRAPEQLAGGAAAPAADVYSLGVLLHEMLRGRPPFAARP
jgi:hypothetical protein